MKWLTKYAFYMSIENYFLVWGKKLIAKSKKAILKIIQKKFGKQFCNEIFPVPKEGVLKYNEKIL